MIEILHKILPFSGGIIMVLFWGIIFPAMNARSNRNIWGKYIDDAFAVNFLNVYLDEYMVAGHLLVHKSNLRMPYISKGRGIFCAYYIQDIGRIRKKTQASRMIDNKFFTRTYGI